jgi:hypothetical protein
MRLDSIDEEAPLPHRGFRQLTILLGLDEREEQLWQAHCTPYESGGFVQWARCHDSCHFHSGIHFHTVSTLSFGWTVYALWREVSVPNGVESARASSQHFLL